MRGTLSSEGDDVGTDGEQQSIDSDSVERMNSLLGQFKEARRALSIVTA